MRLVVGIWLLCLIGYVLTGCAFNYKDIKFGDKVKVTSGMYEGCVGYVTDSFSWLGICEYNFMVSPMQCPKGSLTSKSISVCDLEKM